MLPDLGIEGRYVCSDPDIVPIEECPLDAIEYFGEILDRYPGYIKAGFGLRIDDLPEHYAMRDQVRVVERYNWERPIAPRLYDGFIDTTFALYRGVEAFDQVPAVRTGYPYLARHTTWYLDEQNLPEEERFYRDRSTLTPWWSRDKLPPKLDRLVGAMRDRARPAAGAGEALGAWGEEPEPHDETAYTPWAEEGWHSWNDRSPEVEFCDFAAAIVRQMRPRVVLECGTGEGFMTRRLAGALAADGELISFEADDDARGALAGAPVLRGGRAPARAAGDSQRGGARTRGPHRARLGFRSPWRRSWSGGGTARRPGTVAAGARHRERPSGRLTSGADRRADHDRSASPA